MERLVRPLVAEAQTLEAAQRALAGRDAGRTSATTARRPGTKRPRAPRGANRAAILAALADEELTAGEVATKTGIGSNVANTTLSAMKREGVVKHRSRGRYGVWSVA